MTSSTKRYGKDTGGPPIFIVGAPRSGTTLLAAFIGGHSAIACGPETQFFNKLSQRQLDRAVEDPKWPRLAIQLVLSLTLAEQKVYELFDVSENEVSDYLSNRSPGVDAIIGSLTETYASKHEKFRWAEKTPNHLLHLDNIRATFPYSPIIRIIRDPRDSASSMKVLPAASESVLANCFTWNTWYKRSRGFFKSDENSLTVKYEDLVVDPEIELRRICHFIKEPFETAMLETTKSGEAVGSANEPWKAQVSQKVDVSRVFAWRRDMSPLYRKAADFICLDGIVEWDYELPELPESAEEVFPINRRNVALNEPLFLRKAEQGVRLIASPAPIKAHHLTLLTGLDGDLVEKCRMYVLMLGIILLRRMLGRSTYLYLRSLENRPSVVYRLPHRVLKLLTKPVQ